VSLPRPIPKSSTSRQPTGGSSSPTTWISACCWERCGPTLPVSSRSAARTFYRPPSAGWNGRVKTSDFEQTVSAMQADLPLLIHLAGGQPGRQPGSGGLPTHPDFSAAANPPAGVRDQGRSSDPAHDRFSSVAGLSIEAQFRLRRVPSTTLISFSKSRKLLGMIRMPAPISTQS
jgi:hypothetical protein